jgi:repressor LexA
VSETKPLVKPKDRRRPKPTISARQRKILRFITASVEARGFPPTVREIAVHVGLASTSSVAHQLRQLADKGYLQRESSVSRGLKVTIPGDAA